MKGVGDYIYLFEAKYYDLDSEREIARKIEFDGDNFFQTEKECCIYAMNKAYDMKQKNEYFDSLKFIAC